MTDQRVIVTGGAGFIGSHVARALLAQGSRVLVYDNLDPYYDSALKHKNIASLHGSASSKQLSVVEGDITDADRVASTFASFEPTSLIHLAARAGVRPSIMDPAGYTKANVLGTQVVLEAATRAGCDRAILASSSSVYGNNDKTPFSEDDPVEHPISPYAATKRASELIAHSHHHLTGMPIAMLRFFTVFGPAQRPDLAISIFLDRVSRGEPIRMFGDGSTSRDYTFVDDIVSGVLAAHDRVDAHGYRIWNLGGDHPISLRELIETVGMVVGKDPVVQQEPMQPGDVDRTWADLSRSQAELGYRPETSVREGIERQFAAMSRIG